jgi:hypothetical protein
MAQMSHRETIASHRLPPLYVGMSVPLRHFLLTGLGYSDLHRRRR